MDFPEQPEPSSSPGGFTEPTAFEESHVAQVYDFIAPHFSGTRYKPWPQIVAFLQTFQPYAFIADVGCGNGKYEGCNETAVMHGSDLSPELLKFAQQRGMQCIVSTNLNLPYRSQSMDGFISIAVIHHFDTPHRRKFAVREMARLLKPGGRGLIYVWSLEGQNGKYTTQDAMVHWYFKPGMKSEAPLPAHAEHTEKGILVERYYHLFVKGELEQLILDDSIDDQDAVSDTDDRIPLSAIVDVIRTGFDHDNWLVEIQKK